jgi:hypothetical protein
MRRGCFAAIPGDSSKTPGSLAHQNLHCYAAQDGGKLELPVFGLGNTRAQLSRKEMDRVAQLMFRYVPEIA